MKHTPVLLKEVLAHVPIHPSGRYIDATLGDGGHAEAILQAASSDSRLLGLDQDPQQLVVAQARLLAYSERITLVNARFSCLKQEAHANGFEDVDAILLDLGISSRQLDDPAYGLGFADETPLDMRLSPNLRDTAADFLNHANEQTIADVLYRYGDRYQSRTLARNIVFYRRKKAFKVASDLKAALRLSRPSSLAPIFQALRIWVNHEYDELEQVLPQALELLKPGGNLLVISFHSGEDRIVKHWLREHHELLKVLPRVMTASFDEIILNSRARSAKLRVATKVA